MFLGNQVLNQDYDDAVFEELGNAPANLESGRIADCWGLCPGFDSETADAIQAYLQAEVRGDACWIELPFDARPGQLWGPTHIPDNELRVIKEVWSMKKVPVVRMRRALYRHPHSVTDWDVFCSTEVNTVGFESVGTEWPSVFYHRALKLLLTIYVDDFKLAGPKGNLAEGWKLLRSRLEIGPESSSGMYLGCNIIKNEIRRPQDRVVLRSITYDMESFLEQCVARYLTVAGVDVKLREARTPFLPPTSSRGPYRDPVHNQGGCKWCGYDQPGGPCPPDSHKESQAIEQPTGQLAAVAASVLMKCMYAARMARFDLLRAVQGLAKYLSLIHI